LSNAVPLQPPDRRGATRLRSAWGRMTCRATGDAFESKEFLRIDRLAVTASELSRLIRTQRGSVNTPASSCSTARFPDYRASFLRNFPATRRATVPSSTMLEGSGMFGGGGLKFSTRLRPSPVPKAPARPKSCIKLPFRAVSLIPIPVMVQSKNRWVPSVSTPVETVPKPQPELIVVPPILAPVTGLY